MDVVVQIVDPTPDPGIRLVWQNGRGYGCPTMMMGCCYEQTDQASFRWRATFSPWRKKTSRVELTCILTP